MNYLKLILDAWPILWVLPFFFGILTCVVVVTEIRTYRKLVATRRETQGLTQTMRTSVEDVDLAFFPLRHGDGCGNADLAPGFPPRQNR